MAIDVIGMAETKALIRATVVIVRDPLLSINLDVWQALYQASALMRHVHTAFLSWRRGRTRQLYLPLESVQSELFTSSPEVRTRQVWSLQPFHYLQHDDQG